MSDQRPAAAECTELELQARLAEEQGLWRCAEERWRRVVQRLPTHGAGWHRLGKVLAHQDRWTEALQCQRRSCELHGSIGWNWFAAGEALEHLGCLMEAATAFRQAAWCLPGQSWVLERARQAEQRAWLGGERLDEGLGPHAYRHWCERLEPPLPRPGQRLLERWWRPVAPGRWVRWDEHHQVVEQQEGHWPRGEGWLLLMAPDARLRREALLALEAAVAAAPVLPDLVYPDEDRLDSQGRRCDPWFKPGWVPESFWSSPWLDACSVWRLGWLRRQVDLKPPGCTPVEQFGWQLEALACMPRVCPVPLVLAHRVSGNRRDSGELSQRAVLLQSHLRSLGENVSVSVKNELGHFALQWALPVSPPRVQIVIPTKDRADLLGRCLESVWRTCEPYGEWCISLVDHASSEPATARLLESWRNRLGDRFRVLPVSGPFNWSRFNNLAIAAGNAPIVLMLNNDIEAVKPGWLEAMVAQALRPAVGAVGALLTYPDGRIQHAGVQLGFSPSSCSAEHAYRGLSRKTEVHRGRVGLLTGWAAVTGACLLVQRRHWRAVGGFDEQFPVEFNDVDFCLRLHRHGLRHLVEPAACLIHHECQTRQPVDSPTAGPALDRINQLHPDLMRSSAPWWPAACSALHTDGRPVELANYG